MKTPRIMIVDDEPGIRQSLRGILEDEAFQVEAVENGEACLDLLARSIFELVILDIWLPGIDGLETLHRIQGIPQADRPVVVVISGHGTIETAVKATKLGAYDFLEKPLAPEWGAPVRLRIPTKLGFKSAKNIQAISVTNTYSGGYWEDQGYNWFSGS